ncbi:MAG: efflux RND transporter periplasmic adaptor subunit [Halioglobus sp.]|nr:efflux RND transporter periplasmic adaptor subunit [Halioglobus sp.]
MNKLIAVTAILCLAVGAALGYYLSDSAVVETAAPAPEEPLFYRHPMNPSVTSPVPAKDSMGMDYIPVYAEDETTGDSGTVRIDPVLRNNISVRTATAEARTISRTVRAVGRVEYAEDAVVKLHPKVEGWIRDLRVDKTGQAVSDDDILLEIYSPTLVATQQEYLLALDNRAALQDSPFQDIREGAAALAASSRARLALLDVPDHQIRELEQRRAVQEQLHIHAPVAGIVTEIGARPGQYVTPSTELLRIVNLDAVWVYADIYEYELPWVAVGDSVHMTLASLPGRVLKGRVAFIYPYAQGATRTTRVRVVFDNSDGLLRPDTLVNVAIQSRETTALVVPSEAVVRSGTQERVFVETAAGTFEPRRVALGIESDGYVEVQGGVQAGERVVVSAQFLIDSESQLREAAAKMTDAGVAQ